MDFEERGVRIVAVSVDSPEEAATMRTSAAAAFDSLSDPEGKLMDLFGLRHSGGRYDGADIPQSASVLIDSSGRLVRAWVAENYRVRPSPEEILRRIDGL